MYLTTVNAILHEIENPALTPNEKALLRCRLTKKQEQAGDYEAASEALAELWQGIGARPNLEGLNDETQAEVLLRVGAVTGWIGSASQVEGAQEAAKDLISESARLFESLGQSRKAAEAQSDLALCYWREGAFDEARITLDRALNEFGDADLEQKAIALLRKGIIERTSGRLNEALRLYEVAAKLFNRITDDLLIAHFHHAFANALKDVTANENLEAYADRALMEYTAASFHFEQAGHVRFQGCVENNIGSLLGIIGKFEDAHEHLDRAQMLMTRLKDNVHLAQVDDTRARVLLAEGRNVEAEKRARAAVLRLEKGDELSWLAEALTTHGTALARLNHPEQARTVFEQAISISERAGDFGSAGLAALTSAEELGAALSHKEVCATIDHARTLLEKTQNIGTLRRLSTAAFRALFDSYSVAAPPDWTNFSLKQAVLRFESHLINIALLQSEGSVTKAARLLGYKHHQNLVSLISSRHKELLTVRSPARKRRQPLIAHPKRKRK